MRSKRFRLLRRHRRRNAAAEVKWTFEGTARSKWDEADSHRGAAVAGREPAARNFRLDARSARLPNTALTPSGPNTWVGKVKAPASAGPHSSLEMTFPGTVKFPLKLTSGCACFRISCRLRPRYPSGRPRRERPGVGTGQPLKSALWDRFSARGFALAIERGNLFSRGLTAARWLKPRTGREGC